MCDVTLAVLLLTWCVKEADGLGCAVHIHIHVVRTNGLEGVTPAAAAAAAQASSAAVRIYAMYLGVAELISLLLLSHRNEQLFRDLTTQKQGAGSPKLPEADSQMMMSPQTHTRVMPPASPAATLALRMLSDNPPTPCWP
jgi:hypothetical protein